MVPTYTWNYKVQDAREVELFYIFYMLYMKTRTDVENASNYI